MVTGYLSCCEVIASLVAETVSARTRRECHRGTLPGTSALRTCARFHEVNEKWDREVKPSTD
jgi:hypothetical protein